MADVNSQNKIGNSALILASKEGHRDIVKLLLDNKASTKLKNQDGYNALHFGILYKLLFKFLKIF